MTMRRPKTHQRVFRRDNYKSHEEYIAAVEAHYGHQDTDLSDEKCRHKYRALPREMRRQFAVSKEVVAKKNAAALLQRMNGDASQWPTQLPSWTRGSASFRTQRMLQPKMYTADLELKLQRIAAVAHSSKLTLQEYAALFAPFPPKKDTSK